MQANVDFVEKNNVDIGVGLFNGVVRATITHVVHDSIIASVFSVFGGLFNILIGVTSSSYNVPIASTNRQKIVLQVPIVVLRIERKMWCKFQSLPLMDLDLKWILKVHNKIKCFRKIAQVQGSLGCDFSLSPS